MEGIERNKLKEREIENIDRKIKVVDREVLSQRLIVLNDDKDFQTQIYPCLLQVASHELPPIAIAGVITLAIERQTFGDRSNPSNQLVRMFVPHFVDAMIENPADAEQVKEILRQHS
jgi:hypothetical protein